MIIEQSEHIIREVRKAFIGRDEVIKRILMTIYAGGHILMEDCPGVGKTTLALTFSKVLGLEYKRVQFTMDTLPSDITGFTMLNSQTNQFEYRPGAANCNLLLADEINRTSPKTQAALLEIMEEHNVTVDGVTYALPRPFICIATQNPLGAAGTQPLPESQMDRFMVRLSIGYPSTEDQMTMLKAHRYQNPMENLQQIVSRENIMEVQQYLSSVQVKDEVLEYIIRLCEETRKLPLVDLGVSPRGVIALTKMARANAVMAARSYVTPGDVQEIFTDVCAHRLVLKPQAQVEGVSATELLEEVLSAVRPPAVTARYKDA